MKLVLTNTELAHLLENLATAILLLDPDGRIAFVNSSTQVLLETSATRLVGLHYAEVILAEPGGLVAIENGLASEQSFGQSNVSIGLAGGGSVTVDYTISTSPSTALTSKQLPYRMIEMQAKDHVRRISLEEEQQAEHQAAQILVRGLAHEIKNPLGGIRGAAQLLDRALVNLNQHSGAVQSHTDPNSQPARRSAGDWSEYTSIIIAEADRLKNLVDRLLGPNRALRPGIVNIHEVLERIISLLEVECGCEIEIRRDYDVSIPEFRGDREQLIQGFLNIAKNAVEALIGDEKHKPVRPRLLFRTRTVRRFTLSSQVHKLVLRAELIDNGRGVPPALMKSIFYPMISGRADGTGLGLSITQGIIGQHGGIVECESEPGRTSFIVFIPLEKSS